MRKAIVPVGDVISFLFFMFLVFIAVLYAGHLSRPDDTYYDTFNSINKSKEELNVVWDVYSVPVYIDSEQNISAWNVGIVLALPPDANLESVAVLDSAKKDIPSKYNNSAVFFQPDLVAGRNTFYIIYSLNPNVSEMQYTTDINTSETWVNNSRIKVNFTSQGISSLIFKNTELLSSEIIFGAPSVFSIE